MNNQQITVFTLAFLRHENFNHILQIKWLSLSNEITFKTLHVKQNRPLTAKNDEKISKKTPV